MSAESRPSANSNRVVLITGATGGLGDALARACGAAGYTVALHGRVVRKLETLYDAIVAAGGPEPAILPLDFEIADSQAFDEAANAIDRQLGRLDAVIHCAATLKRLAPIEHQQLGDWISTLRVNLAAPAALTRAMLPLLRRAPSAKVVFTLDSRGHEPGAYWGSYAASKSGLEALVRVLADEWIHEAHLSAIGVIPGPMASPMRRRTHPGDDPASLRPINDLVPLYLELLKPENLSYRGLIVDAQTWLKSGS